MTESEPERKDLNSWIVLDKGCFIKKSAGGYETYGGKNDHPVVTFHGMEQKPIAIGPDYGSQPNWNVRKEPEESMEGCTHGETNGLKTVEGMMVIKATKPPAA